MLVQACCLLVQSAQHSGALLPTVQAQTTLRSAGEGTTTHRISTQQPNLKGDCSTHSTTRKHQRTAACLSFGPFGQNSIVSVNKACARRPGVAASVSRRRRERRTLLAGGGRRASRSHTLAASQAFQRMHMRFRLRG
jgi:hypothetical protein